MSTTRIGEVIPMRRRDHCDKDRQSGIEKDTKQGEEDNKGVNR